MSCKRCGSIVIASKGIKEIREQQKIVETQLCMICGNTQTVEVELNGR